jgi:predicted enzyme related to lactoylglutathione lyase
MKRVTAIGGIFFKTKNPQKTKDWYQKHLGIESDEYGTSFEWRQSEEPEKKGYTAWSPFDGKTDYFGDSGQEFMINYRVENIEELVKQLEAEGVKIVDKIESYEYGKFVHIEDPNGHRIELWEPNDEEYEKIAKKRIK